MPQWPLFKQKRSLFVFRMFEILLQFIFCDYFAVSLSVCVRKLFRIGKPKRPPMLLKLKVKLWKGEDNFGTNWLLKSHWFLLEKLSDIVGRKIRLSGSKVTYTEGFTEIVSSCTAKEVKLYMVINDERSFSPDLQSLNTCSPKLEP